MPLNDWPRTSSFQAAQPAFKLTADQFQGAVDRGSVDTDPYSPGNWSLTLNIATLESTAGIDLTTIYAGLRAGRDSADPDKMRSIKYLPDPDVGVNKFMSLNVEACEAVMGITLLDLRDAIDAAA